MGNFIREKLKQSMIHHTTKKVIVLQNISNYLLDKNVIKELGEPIIHEDGYNWFFKKINQQTVSFGCISQKGVLRFMYTDLEHRGKGFFSEVLEEIEEFSLDELNLTEIKAVSTLVAYQMYLKKGWITTKAYKNFFNIKKTLK